MGIVEWKERMAVALWAAGRDAALALAMTQLAGEGRRSGVRRARRRAVAPNRAAGLILGNV
jgi:hypothetical protein